MLNMRLMVTFVRCTLHKYDDTRKRTCDAQYVKTFAVITFT